MFCGRFYNKAKCRYILELCINNKFSMEFELEVTNESFISKICVIWICIKHFNTLFFQILINLFIFSINLANLDISDIKLIFKIIIIIYFWGDSEVCWFSLRYDNFHETTLNSDSIKTKPGQTPKRLFRERTNFEDNLRTESPIPENI